MITRRSALCGLPWLRLLAEPDFASRAMEHVRRLARSARTGGSEGEARACRYVAGELKKLGLKVTLERFRFRTYALRKATLVCGGQSLPVVRLGFDPFAGSSRIEGEAAYVEPSNDDSLRAFSHLDLENKIVVTRSGARLFALMSRRPRAVAYVSAADAERVDRRLSGKAIVTVEGREQRLASANVVAVQERPSVNREILLTAHLDSVASPGANDNASGVAVMIEAARALTALRLPAKLRFIAFGAEELGLLGSREYLLRHLNEMRACALLVNLDSVGGSGPMFAEMADGVREIPPAISNPLPLELTGLAFDDVHDRWSLLRPARFTLFASSIVPDWLKDTIRAAAKEAGGEFRPGRQMGSDHQVFASAGIVATNLAVAGGFSHSNRDTPENVNAASLDRAGRFAIKLIGDAAHRLG